MKWTAQIAARLATFKIDVMLEGDARPLALIGPNGSGKTTLLRCLCGMTPFHGHFRLGDDVLHRGELGIPIQARRLGYVPQSSTLFPHLTALENVAFGAAGTTVERQAVAARLLGVFDCLDVATQKPSTLSGGERQRVAIARALAAKPRMLLLDEPFSAIDAPSKRAVREALLSHLKARPVILVTHDVRDVREFDAFVVAIEAGEVVQTGELAVIQASPATSFIRDFCEA